MLTAKALAMLPMVQGLQVLRQVSEKCEYDFALSMQFADQSAYDAYHVHPGHVTFVEKAWKSQVEKFQEADFALYQ